MPAYPIDAEFGASFFEAYEPFLATAMAERNDMRDRREVELWIWTFDPVLGPQVFLGDELQLPSGALDMEALANVVLPVEYERGWFGFVFRAGRGVATIDRRSNWGDAIALLDLADEFLDTARRAMTVGHLRPAVENTWAAAELAVQGTLQPFNPTGSHPDRAEQHRRMAAVLLVPSRHVTVLEELRKARSAARYGERDMALDLVAVDRLVSEARDMILLARHRVDEATG